MSTQSKHQENDLPVKSVSAKQSSKKAPRKSLLQVSSYADIISSAEQISADSPRSFEEYFALFESLRKIKELSAEQISRFFSILESGLSHHWIPFFTKMAVSICQTSQAGDSRFIFTIRTKCKSHLETYGITESDLTAAEKNLCLLKDGKFVTQFLAESEKKSQKIKPIAAQDLACLSFICFSLFCRQNLQKNDRIQVQLLIDRAIAEYFSFPHHATITEKDLAGKSLGRILSAKTFSPRNISELTFLYRGTTESLSGQAEKIRSLEEINQNRITRINSLMEELRAARDHAQELEQQLEQLQQRNAELEKAYTASENRMEFEKNQSQNLFKSQRHLLAANLSKTISVDLQAIRDLVEYLDEDDQRRFCRRLDRIDRDLEEFGGER